MTVTLALKAFAKPIPCLTPFLATSDPSVLKRRLAYIWGLRCSSKILPEKVILTYRPIVAARLRPDLEAHSWWPDTDLFANSALCRLVDVKRARFTQSELLRL